MSERSSNNLTLFGLAGVGLAGYMSWIKFHSVFWTVWDAMWGWLYVLYFVIRYGVPK